MMVTPFKPLRLFRKLYYLEQTGFITVEPSGTQVQMLVPNNVRVTVAKPQSPRLQLLVTLTAATHSTTTPYAERR